MRWENVIEKSGNVIQVWVQVWVRARNRSSAAKSMGKLGALDSENTSKQQSNDTQGAAMHLGLLSKQLINLIQFHWSYPCFC